MAVGTGKATRAERRKQKSGTTTRKAKMAVACRPKNEAAIHREFIVFSRYPCVPPTPLQFSSVAMTSHTCLDGVPHDLFEGVKRSRSVYSSLFQSPLQIVAVRLDKLAVFVVGG